MKLTFKEKNICKSKFYDECVLDICQENPDFQEYLKKRKFLYITTIILKAILLFITDFMLISVGASSTRAILGYSILFCCLAQYKVLNWKISFLALFFGILAWFESFSCIVILTNPVIANWFKLIILYYILCGGVFLFVFVWESCIPLHREYSYIASKIGLSSTVYPFLSTAKKGEEINEPAENNYNKLWERIDQSLILDKTITIEKSVIGARLIVDGITKCIYKDKFYGPYIILEPQCDNNFLQVVVSKRKAFYFINNKPYIE